MKITGEGFEEWRKTHLRPFGRSVEATMYVMDGVQLPREAYSEQTESTFDSWPSRSEERQIAKESKIIIGAVMAYKETGAPPNLPWQIKTYQPVTHSEQHDTVIACGGVEVNRIHNPPIAVTTYVPERNQNTLTPDLIKEINFAMAQINHQRATHPFGWR